jgi:hypothetical protein
MESFVLHGGFSQHVGLFAWIVLPSFFGWDAAGWAIIHQCVCNVKMTKLTIIYI